MKRYQASWLVLLATGLLWALITSPAWALGGFGPNGGSSSGGGTVPGAVCGNDGVHALGWDGAAYVCYSITGTGGGVPSITGTANQINQAGSPGAVTLSLSSTLVLPGTLNGNTVPTATDTVVLLNATQTLTGKSIVATQLTGTLQAAQFPALTGDITTVAGALATTLATVNSNTGAWGSATNCPTITLNGKGLATAASQTACTPAFSSVTGSIALSQLPTLAADSFWLNATGSTAVPTAVALPSCSTASSALTYNTTSHTLGCNSISGGSLAYTASFSGNVSGTPGATGMGLSLASATFTDSATAGSGTAALFAVHSVAVPTVAATNLTVVTTHASTLRIAGPPTAGTNETIIAKTALSSLVGDWAMEGVSDTFRMYHLGGPGVTNREEGDMGWVGNLFTVGTFKNGTGAARSLVLNTGAATSMFFQAGGSTLFTASSTSVGANTAASWGLNMAASSATAPTFVPNQNSSSTGIGAQASGNISLIAGGAEITRVTATATTQIAGQTVLKSYTVATLPTGITGGEVVVTDAVACTFAAAVTGGGATFCPVYYNGTAWQAY